MKQHFVVRHLTGNRSLSKGGSGETEGEDTKSIVPDTKDVLMKKTDSSESEVR